MTQNDAKSKQNTQPLTALILAGDVTGTTGVSSVVKLQNINIKSGTPSNGQVFTYISANADWEPSAAVFKAPLAPAIALETNGYNLTSTDATIYFNTGSTPILNLPTSTSTGRIVFISNITGSTGGQFRVIAGTGGTINGSSSITFTRSTAIACYDGLNWIQLA